MKQKDLLYNIKEDFVMNLINGGVCAAKGFKANGIHCGIRKNRTKRDIALIVSDVPASAAAVYTANLVKGNICALNGDGVNTCLSGNKLEQSNNGVLQGAVIWFASTGVVASDACGADGLLCLRYCHVCIQYRNRYHSAGGIVMVLHPVKGKASGFI